MGIEYTLLMLVVLLGIAQLLIPLGARLFLSANVVLMLVGFVGSELIVAAGYDTGIRWHQFHGLIFYALLPILMFEGGLTLNTDVLRRNVGAATVLAVPVLGLSVALIAWLLARFAFADASSAWVLAVLTAVLLATTDTSGLSSRLREHPLMVRARVLLEGEATFSDAMSVVAFSVLVAVATGGMALAAGAAGLRFAIVLFGGIGCGLAGGALAVLVQRHVRRFEVKALATLLIVYGTYILAEALFDVSGVMALFLVGLLSGGAIRREAEASDNRFLLRLWQYKAYLAGAVTFLLLGITITTAMFRDHWQSMLIGIGALLLARTLLVPGGLSAVAVLGGSRTTLRERALVQLGGVPGTVSVVLALSLPLALPGWYQVQSIVYGAVIFSMLAQTPLLSLLLAASRPASASGD